MGYQNKSEFLSTKLKVLSKKFLENYDKVVLNFKSFSR